MKRRAFCSGGLAAFAGAAVSYRRLLADTPTAEIPARGLDGRHLTALIDAMVGATESTSLGGLMMWLQHQGGAISRVRPQDTAYFNRGASHNVGVFQAWKMPATDAEERSNWVRETWGHIEPLTHGQYVNLAATDDREARIHAAYGDNYQRLAALKKRYDPTNLFRLNANIKPA